MHFVDEYAKKVFTRTTPFCDKPTEQWSQHEFQCAQSLIIPGMLYDELYAKKKALLTVVESHWVNVFPYAHGLFGKDHYWTKVVNSLIQKTKDTTFCIFLDHEGIPLEKEGRHTDDEFRIDVAKQVERKLKESDIPWIRLSSCQQERSTAVHEILMTLQSRQKKHVEGGALSSHTSLSRDSAGVF